MKCNSVLRVVIAVSIIALLVFAIPATPALAQTIVLSPTSGIAGTTVTVTGYGFDPFTYPTVYVFFDSLHVATVLVLGSGTFTTYFLVPSTTLGAYSVTIRDSSTYVGSNQLAIAYFDVTARQITVSPTSGYVGSTVTVTGNSFNPSSTVTIYFDTIAVRTVTTNASGSFTNATFTVPESYKGTHAIKGSDTSGDSQVVYFATSQNITITSTSGFVGDSISINGTGFTSTSNISLYWNNTLLSASAITNANGSFTYNAFTIPSNPWGNYTIKARDASGNYATTLFTIHHKTSIMTTSGIVGTEVTISGTGFTASHNMTITFAGITVSTNPASVTTNSEGIFSARFNVPPSASGTHEIKASDGTNESTQTFTITATANISQTEGYVSDGVTFSGSGFQARKPISITFHNENVATDSTDFYGNFSTIFTVPALAADTYQVKVSDGINTKEFYFKINTNASLNPTTSTTSPGHVGTEITINCIGYIADEEVDITYDGYNMAKTTVKADRTFSATFKAPASSGGNHTIVVTDGTNSQSFTFIMESTPPPTPAPLKPEMDIKAKAEAYFAWEDVSDPSGVTYHLQVATDNRFTELSIIVNEEELIDSEFTLTKEEKLTSVKKEAAYYWRVRATDGAFNESVWSQPVSFYVGFQWPALQGALAWASIGITAVLFLLLGFWLGRRTGSYEDYND